jgi:hypothetical protein
MRPLFKGRSGCEAGGKQHRRGVPAVTGGGRRVQEGAALHNTLCVSQSKRRDAVSSAMNELGHAGTLRLSCGAPLLKSV